MVGWHSCTCGDQNTNVDCPSHGCTCEGEPDVDRHCPQHGQEAAFWARVDWEYDRARDK